MRPLLPARLREEITDKKGYPTQGWYEVYTLNSYCYLIILLNFSKYLNCICKAATEIEMMQQQKIFKVVAIMQSN